MRDTSHVETDFDVKCNRTAYESLQDLIEPISSERREDLLLWPFIGMQPRKRLGNDVVQGHVHVYR